MAPSRSFPLALLASLAATEGTLRLADLTAHSDGLAALRSPGLVLLALALGVAGWAVARSASGLPPRLAGALAVACAVGMAAGAVRQLPRAAAADVQWWNSDAVALAPVDVWRARPRRWRALVAGGCGITSVVEVERRGGRAVLTERSDVASTPFLLAYALGGWRRLPAGRRAVPAFDRDPATRRPPEARGWALIDDGAGARLAWR